jgi:hypothetical protein
LCCIMVGLGIYCPKIFCIQKIAEIKNITNSHKNFLLNCGSWQIFALISLLNVFLQRNPCFQTFPLNISRPYLFFVLCAIVFPVKIKIIFLC